MVTNTVPRLCVMLDTSILHTQVASDLFRQSIKTLIEENSTHTDLKIEWYIPKTVIGERKFQMEKGAWELMPSLHKLEKLIGHSFGLGKDSLAMYVDTAIATAIKNHSLIISEVDTKKIDWDQLIERSVNRRAPFEDNEKEKGFRDAMIAYSFYQLCEIVPSTSKLCKLALVSGDEKLKEFVAELTNGKKNVRILNSQDELESLINTLVSEIPEELAESLSEKAGNLFFESKNEKSLFYKYDIRKMINEKYKSELENSTVDGQSKSGGTWYISKPVFIKKERARIYWSSTIEVAFELYHYDTDEGLGAYRNHIGLRDPLHENPFSSHAYTQNISNASSTIYQNKLLTGLPNFKKIIDREGRDLFEVHWSTTLSQAKNLTSAKIEKITYIGNNLAD